MLCCCSCDRGGRTAPHAGDASTRALGAWGCRVRELGKVTMWRKQRESKGVGGGGRPERGVPEEPHLAVSLWEPRPDPARP